MRIDVTAFAFAAAALFPLPAQALLCGTVLEPVRVTTAGLSFGSYFPGASSDLHVNGTLTLDCGALSADLLPSFTIQLGGGNAGATPSPRYMLKGSTHLNYNLYTSSSYGTVWSTGAGQTVSYSTLLDLGSVNFTVYGAVFKGQFVATGTYNDTVVVTVNY
jgi:spore coat protein U domain-containing protein, fimbrial subunit CupE1/2/3/6